MSVGPRLRLQLCSAALSTGFHAHGYWLWPAVSQEGDAGSGGEAGLGSCRESRPVSVLPPSSSHTVCSDRGGWGASSLFAVCLLIPTKPGSVSRKDAAWTLQAPPLLCLPHRGLIVEQSFSQPSPPCVFCEPCLTHSGTSLSHPSPSAFRSSGEEDVARVIGAPRSDAVTVSIRWTFLTVH